MQEKTYSNRDVAELLGLKTYQIIQAVYNRRATAPQKDSGGRYVWTYEGIRQLRSELGKQVSDEVVL